jgi:hypothetical protein
VHFSTFAGRFLGGTWKDTASSEKEKRGQKRGKERKRTVKEKETKVEYHHNNNKTTTQLILASCSHKDAKSSPTR